MVLILYNFLWILFLPFILIVIIFRIIIGKEDIMRIKERIGIASSVRSTKLIIWIHAASVGESRIALCLAKQFNDDYPKHRVLITTGTITSANMVRSFTSAKIAHQFIPMDNWISIWMFFNYWKPDIGILIESELWPNLLHIGAKFCPLILVNARMSDVSFSKWYRFRFIAKGIIKKFTHILCQSEKDTKKYKSLGVDAIYIGNLKYSTAPLEVNQPHLVALEKMIKKRPVFLAASTHSGDEEIMIEAHLQLKDKYPDILTIIAPRHIKRAKDICELIKKSDLSYSVRSLKDKINSKTDIYIVDTMGELGTLFNLANVSFIGGSFKNGGHNPIEAAYFDTYIIFGPNMTNFTEVAQEFLQYKAATQIQNIDELVESIDKVFAGQMNLSQERSKVILTNHMNVMIKYLEYVKNLLRKK